MSRGSVGNEPKRATKQVDRRDVQAPRVQFEALVELGDGKAGGFEAESVDVSPDGIRLRTAYLPEIGERLVCRFDGFGGEVVAEGEVIWRREQGRGGEFGLRFIGLDEHGAQLLQEMCNPPAEAQPEPPAEPEAGIIGSRVKLHIEGLGSPMRARVKDTARGEVLVGSSLEFLRVGRDIELEDVDHGGRRTAMIEHVGVEIDRANNVPQLVVSLRYDDAKGQPAEIEEAPSAQRSPSRPGGLHASPPKEITPEPTVIDREERDEKVMARGRAAMPPARAPRLEIEATDDELGDEDLSQDQPPTLATPHSRGESSLAGASSVEVEGAGKKLGEVAKAFGPKLLRASQGAKTALGSLLAAVKKKRDDRDESRGTKAAKRTTAPPPGGALRTEGRRLVRQDRKAAAPEEQEDTDAELDALRSSPNRKGIAAAVIGALLVIGVYVFASQVGQKGAAQEPAVAALASSASPEGGTAETAASGNAAAQPVPGGAVATANVPLFGATPLSTTEPVPTPPNADALAAEAEGAPAGDSAAPKEGDASGDDAEVGSDDALKKEWRVGEVHDANPLKLSMDGPISGFKPSEGGNGFTLVVPGRKSVSSAAGLTQKDKRLENVGIVNYPDRAEITVHFKGDAPGYAVKANGNRLTIELDGGRGEHGGDDDEASSHKKSKTSVKSGHEKSKGEKSSKKHDSKTGKHSEASNSDKKKSDKKSEKKADKKAHK